VPRACRDIRFRNLPNAARGYLAKLCPRFANRATASLGCAKRLSRKPFVIVTTYIDESGTRNDAQHIILGGWVGRWGQWYTFNPKWEALLKSNSLTYFLSKEMHHSEGE
jgi:hypothetical protein